jgi:hypothetical protein
MLCFPSQTLFTDDKDIGVLSLTERGSLDNGDGMGTTLTDSVTAERKRFAKRLLLGLFFPIEERMDLRFAARTCGGFAGTRGMTATPGSELN